MALPKELVKNYKEMKCPKCGNTIINQYRQITGPIWCDVCGFRANHKERDNPFLLKPLLTQAQKMDNEVAQNTGIEKRMQELIKKVEEDTGFSCFNWDEIDPRKLVYTIVQLSKSMPENKAAIPEPMPDKGQEIVLRHIINDLHARSEMGEKKYGTVLKTHNGRDALMDAYQEQLDNIMYTKQLLIEREEELKILCQAYALLAEQKRPETEIIALSADLLFRILKKRNVSGAEINLSQNQE